ncbi:glucose-6-phosphate dehydrogenase assembly protein OpcA [Nostocoides jenkinsii]|uniref:Oxppcycle protein n=1 Tax=Nostocoides jenkinsii Ben 74 TaxID=1193518 RepID=A0A077MEZ7_9MICO|nr:glucose-6-phosphate dehydrogenase assembly protein OpcA [Tetrasphaera jenkinsii]CCI54570.1 conserved hypothetical protein [Tetrasphaera jenkinsii Ben 74]
MIVDLPSTNTETVSKRLLSLREDVGAMALGRVLTLVIPVDEALVDQAVDIANEASRQHPCRVLALVTGNPRGKARLDAQIRVGGDAGASEVVVLRMYGPLAKHGRSVATPLLLADSPIVAWWPGDSPADPGEDPIGAIAQRRITDAAAAKRPHRRLAELAAAYAGGDTDLAWTRVTLWRGRLAAALDHAPYESVTSATVTGAGDSPSALLLAAWLEHFLQCPVTIASSPSGTGIISVQLDRPSGPVVLDRPRGKVATLVQPGQPDRIIALPPRSDAECLSDELRRLDADEVYADTLVRGLGKVSGRKNGTTTKETTR